MASKTYININYPKLTIYALVSEDEPNVIRYVGITRRNPSYRLNSHIYDAKNFSDKNSKTRWISSKNYKIKQIILDEIYGDYDAIFWEQYWINQIKVWGFVLTNSNNGGGGLNKRNSEFSEWLSNRNKGNKYNLGKKHTKETKNKMSLKKIGKISPRKGCVVTKETKEKQALAKIGKVGNATGFKHTEETKNKKRKKVFVLNINNKVVMEFNSVSETARYFEIQSSTISIRLNKNKEYKGFIFKTKIENNG
jgi:group I intron endonuclease